MRFEEAAFEEAAFERALLDGKPRREALLERGTYPMRAGGARVATDPIETPARRVSMRRLARRGSAPPGLATVPTPVERRGAWLTAIAAVLLGAFALWAACVIWEVRELRAELERAVSWTGSVHELQGAVEALAAAADTPSAGDFERADEAISALESALDAMQRDPAIAGELGDVQAELEGLGRAIDARDVVAAREWSADVLAWAGRIVPALRARSRAISGELASAWTGLQTVAVASIVLAGLVLVLLRAALRTAERLRVATTELAAAHARLADADRAQTRARTLVEVSRALEGPVGQVDTNLGATRGYVRSIESGVSMLRDALIERGGAETAASIAASYELDVVLDDLPHALDSVQAAARRVRGVLDDLERWREGARPTRSTEDLHALVHTVVAGARRGLPRGLSIELELAEGASAPVFATAVAQALHDALRWVAEPLRDEGRVRVSLRLQRSGAEISLEGAPPARERESDPPPPVHTPPALVLARWVVVERHGGALEAAATSARSRRVLMTLPTRVSEG